MLRRDGHPEPLRSTSHRLGDACTPAKKSRTAGTLRAREGGVSSGLPRTNGAARICRHRNSSSVSAVSERLDVSERARLCAGIDGRRSPRGRPRAERRLRHVPGRRARVVRHPAVSPSRRPLDRAPRIRLTTRAARRRIIGRDPSPPDESPPTRPPKLTLSPTIAS